MAESISLTAVGLEKDTAYSDGMNRMWPDVVTAVKINAADMRISSVTCFPTININGTDFTFSQTTVPSYLAGFAQIYTNQRMHIFLKREAGQDASNNANFYPVDYPGISEGHERQKIQGGKFEVKNFGFSIRRKAMLKEFSYKADHATMVFKDEEYYVWDSAVIKVGNQYHLFYSRWKKELGFGWNWLYNSQIAHAVSSTPVGPYKFRNVVFERRGKKYFDGMNTHNTCIKYYGGKFYLYYMGTTYDGDENKDNVPSYPDEPLDVWDNKRIGLAIADDINGEFKRLDAPILLPREKLYWDCTVTTNPSVAILPNGKTYMAYKSRSERGGTLQIGIAVADKPDGEFKRLTENPILGFSDENKHVEDPFLWYDDKRKKFCMLAKDDSKNNSEGITGEWGAGFYAESDDCIHFELPEEPKVYSRTLEWADGRKSVQCNLERPSLLFDDNGEPVYLYCASGDGDSPYAFNGATYIVAIKLKRK